jgi:hypothetical protein
LDFEAPLDACVLRDTRVHALVLAQGPSWLVLYGPGLDAALPASAWRMRFHRLKADRARRFSHGVAPDLSWPPRWTVGGHAHAIVRGYVAPGPALMRLADLARERVEECDGALLCLPTAHDEHAALRIDSEGTLHAFGVSIDTRRRFAQRYVWALGQRNANGDADAIVLEQDGEALCLSMNERPGGWPSVGALPAAAPELPTPALPLDELVTPAAFAALDGWLARRENEDT